ncbi:MAG: PQQ-binding-like beta-propeller repeat protein [Vicinamibacterales bacterium]|nr:PQQ-binding-like beta-propeller repeat protein [Vicinamibacterales bacterium]
MSHTHIWRVARALAVVGAMLSVPAVTAAQHQHDHAAGATSMLTATPLTFGLFKARFESDGAFTLEGWGWPTFTGEWRRAGDQLAIVTATGPAGCEAMGRYRLTESAADVRLAVVEDACRPRQMILDGSTWVPEGTPVVHAERRITRHGAEARPLPAPAPAAGSWPSFRGPLASGVADGQRLPVRWNGTTGEQILWRVAVPGLAHSSPIVWGDRVFVTTAVSSDPNATFRPGLYGDGDASEDRSPQRWMVIAFDKRTGAKVWEQVAHEGPPVEKRHIKSTYASATPATDGRIVVAWFGSHGVHAYTVDGDPLWRVDLGRVDLGAYDIPTYEWGTASSPIIWNDLVILQCDTQADSFLLALDARTGEVVWKTARDEFPSWGTPSVLPTSAGPELVTNASNFIRGYDPKTGDLRWQLGGSSKITAPTPILAGDTIVVASGRAPERPLFAVRPGARGDLTLPEGVTSAGHVAWSYTGRGSYMPTPLYYDGLLYVLGNNGIFDAYDARTGAEVYRQRLPEIGSGFSASPVAADGHIYLSSEDGDVIVIAAGREFRLVATNPMGDLLMATPALSEGVMYVRSAGSLFAVSGAVAPRP